MFVPEANEVGTPYVTFNVSFRLAEEPTLVSEPVAVSIDVTAVDDVPTVHAFSYSILESGGEWRENGLWCTQVKGLPGPPPGCTVDQMPIFTSNSIDVQLLATDDPNEIGRPLELFITSLPTKGQVYC